MQSNALKPLLAKLTDRFSRAEFVQFREQGFQDAGRWAYVRSEAEDDYEFRVEDDWVIGTYVAVAEDALGASVLDDLLRAVQSAGGEVTAFSATPDVICLAEIETKPSREMNVAKVAFTLRTPELNCMGC